jgi:hypothetical protein
MDEKSHSDNLNELEPSKVEQGATTEDATTGDSANNRRNFLTRAALGVAGTAGLMALGASESRAAGTKSRILERIQAQMAQQDIVPIDDGGEGGGGYIKSTHGLYVK